MVKRIKMATAYPKKRRISERIPIKTKIPVPKNPKITIKKDVTKSNTIGEICWPTVSIIIRSRGTLVINTIIRISNAKRVRRFGANSTYPIRGIVIALFKDA